MGLSQGVGGGGILLPSTGGTRHTPEEVLPGGSTNGLVTCSSIRGPFGVGESSSIPVCHLLSHQDRHCLPGVQRGVPGTVLTEGPRAYPSHRPAT